MTGVAAFEYQERVTAFVDVLGFADIVSKSDNDFNSRIRVANIIQTFRLFEQFFSKYMPDVDRAFFSDTFVISMQNPALNTFYIIREVGYLCRRLMLQGLVSRGAITAGALIHDGQIVVGPALVAAYQLEQSIAIYPRVVLDAETLTHWTADTSAISAMDSLGPLVKRDVDGQYFLDLFEKEWGESFIPWTDAVPDFEPLPTGYSEFLNAARDLIALGCREHANNLRVLQKYEWLNSQLHAHLKKSEHQVMP